MILDASPPLPILLSPNVQNLYFFPLLYNYSEKSLQDLLAAILIPLATCEGFVKFRYTLLIQILMVQF